MNPQRAIGLRQSLPAVSGPEPWIQGTVTLLQRLHHAEKCGGNKCFFVMNIGAASLIIVSSCYLISFLFRVFRLFHLHLERSAFDDSENERRKLIVSAGGTLRIERTTGMS